MGREGGGGRAGRAGRGGVRRARLRLGGAGAGARGRLQFFSWPGRIVRVVMGGLVPPSLAARCPWGGQVQPGHDGTATSFGITLMGIAGCATTRCEPRRTSQFRSGQRPWPRPLNSGGGLRRPSDPTYPSRFVAVVILYTLATVAPDRWPYARVRQPRLDPASGTRPTLLPGSGCRVCVALVMILARNLLCFPTLLFPLVELRSQLRATENFLPSRTGGTAQNL